MRKDQLPKRDRHDGVTIPKSAPSLDHVFYGIIRHQKADGRSPLPSTVTPTVSPPTGGTAMRDGFWNAALHLQARHFRLQASDFHLLDADIRGR